MGPSFLVSLAVFFLVLALFTSADPIRQRLNKYSPKISTHNNKLQEPFTQRIIGPLRRWMIKKFSGLLPKGKKEIWQKRLWRAGFITAIPADLAAAKLVSATITAVVPLLLLLDKEFHLLSAGQAVIPAAIMGYLFPDLIIARRIALRKRKAERELPDCLDLLTISVEAGLGLDAALMRVMEKGKGVLAQEFAYLLRELQMGQSRKRAWRNLAERVGTEGVNNFTAAVIQAEQLGVGLTHVLRSQGNQVRMKHRQAVEEQAMKAPVKMLLPLVLFIFPTMFIVLLGPALIQIVRVLGQ